MLLIRRTPSFRVGRRKRTIDTVVPLSSSASSSSSSSVSFPSSVVSPIRSGFSVSYSSVPTVRFKCGTSTVSSPTPSSTLSLSSSVPFASTVPKRYHGSHSHGTPDELFGPSSSSSSSSATATDSTHGNRGDDEKMAQRAINAGALSNLLLAAVKGIGGHITGSAVLMADAVHSLADLGSDAISLVTWKLARAPADVRFPYGKGRVESFGAFLISASLVAAGTHLGWESVEMLLQLATVTDEAGSNEVTDVVDVAYSLPSMYSSSSLSSFTNLVHDPEAFAHSTFVMTHGDSSGAHIAEFAEDSTLAFIAVSAATGSVIMKEALYRWTMSLATRLRSSVLAANAWHHRTDALSSIVAMIGVGGALGGIPALDPIAAIVVAAMIIKQGTQLCYSSVSELLDKRLDSDTLKAIEEVLAATPDITTHRRLRARRVGPWVLVDLEMGLRPSLTLSAAHHVADDIRAKILENRKEVADVLIHTFPDESSANVYCADESCPGAHVTDDLTVHAHAAHPSTHATDPSLRSHHDDPRPLHRLASANTASGSSYISSSSVHGNHGHVEEQLVHHHHHHHHHNHGHGGTVLKIAPNKTIGRNRSWNRHGTNGSSTSPNDSSSSHNSTVEATITNGIVNDGSSSVSGTIGSPTSLEIDIRKAAATIPNVRAVTHLRLHYISNASSTAPALSTASSSSSLASKDTPTTVTTTTGNRRIRVEMEVLLGPETMTLQESIKVVRQIRAAVEALPLVAVADVHVEVDPA